jgi:hypothetical protein
MLLLAKTKPQVAYTHHTHTRAHTDVWPLPLLAAHAFTDRDRERKGGREGGRERGAKHELRARRDRV